MSSESNTRTMCGVTFSLKPYDDNIIKNSIYRITVSGSVSNSISKEYSEEEFAKKGLAIALILLNLDNNNIQLVTGEYDCMVLTESVLDLIPFEFGKFANSIKTLVEYFGEENTHYIPNLLDIPEEEQRRIITEYVEKDGEEYPEDVLNCIGLEIEE